MDNDKGKFEQQDHPLKNTDKAFVQVGKNGEPVMPEHTEESNKTEKPGEKRNITYDRP
ncbi:hypothetical protein [Flavisolibacter ginsenosidimutans]|uniref:hypothetical protein n=1 Tax=Flavisolibacter ginsenosidimutans TaxID=661481 RepID=UPI00155A4A50|nr:hypothetical protein [Flavisolibacter ginsenosidimutans]